MSVTTNEPFTLKIETGILHPKRVNRFFIKLKNGSSSSRQSEILSQQCVKVLPFSMNSGELVIECEDDLGNQLSKFLDELLSHPPACDDFITLDILNGGSEIVETYTFHDLQLKKIETMGLDYGGNSSQRTTVTLGSNSPDFNVIVEGLSDELQVLYHAFRQLKATLSVSDLNSSGAIRKRIHFDYRRVSKAYPVL